MDSTDRDEQKDADDPDYDSSHINQKSECSLSETVDDTNQCCIKIKEGTDPGEREDEITRQSAVKKQGPQKLPEYQKKKSAEDTKTKAAEQNLFDEVLLLFLHRFYGHFCNGGCHQKRYCVGDRGGKEDTGQCHSGENPIDAQCLGGITAGSPELERDGERLNALQYVEQNPVGRQWRSNLQ